MDHKTWLGSLAEAKVRASLIEQGFDVFTSISGKAPFDLIAYRDQQLVPIEVKGTQGTNSSDGSYEVNVSSTRSNRTGNVRYHFDAEKSDVLAIYVQVLDIVCFFVSSSLHGRRSISLRQIPNRTRNRLRSWIVSEHSEMPMSELVIRQTTGSTQNDDPASLFAHLN